MSSIDRENVASSSRQAGAFALDIEPAKPREENIFAADYYEILRVGPQADEETINRVYRTLADRFHPDNPGTGDAETFLRLEEAYETLSSPVRRAKYNALRQYNRGPARFRLRAREFFDGVRGDRNRRLAVLCLLYRERIGNYESKGLTILDLEHLTGCTREELVSALWYLCEKKWGTSGEVTAYSITVDGFDVVESKLEDRLEFRALATVCYYSLPPAAKDSGRAEARFRNDIPLFDIEPGATIEGCADNHTDNYADHYEVLGIGPQADEEAIERVYGTLADRFYPDNPGTGDAKILLRIREAYDTLSDPARRTQYDAVRQRTKHSARFRFKGREFFDGIKGEQLRRLAVLCILYREGTSESQGLTVLDLEQLTGCTREELGSALWYLREKKWAKSGDFTEYSITAAGFDVVESKLEEREARSTASENPPSIAAQEVGKNEESMPVMHQMQRSIPIDEADPEDWEAAGSWTWPGSEAYGDGFAYPYQGSESQPAEESEMRQEESAAKNPEAAQGPVRMEHAPVSADSGARPEARVIRMSHSNEAIAEPAVGASVSARKRVILSMGGKGGVGKTSVMTGLAEWFEENLIPVTLLDLDVENKARGSLTHFFGGRVPKIDIHTPAGLDAFVDRLADVAPVILGDMGAGAGKITHDWFETMYPDVAEAGIVFTAIGVVTSDPASVESVLNWAAALQDRVDYVIAENSLSEHADFTYWREHDRAVEFRQRFQPAVIRLDYRLADLENAVRNYGVTLGQVAGRRASAPELQKASLVMRAQSYRRRMFAEFDRVKELLLP